MLPKNIKVNLTYKNKKNQDNILILDLNFEDYSFF
jgi:hypothetical protein